MSSRAFDTRGDVYKRQLYGFQLKAQLARQLQDRQLLLETLRRLGQAESPAVSHPARLLLTDVLVNPKCSQNAAAILEQLKTETEDWTDSNRLIRSYAELIEGTLAGKQGKSGPGHQNLLRRYGKQILSGKNS